VTTAQLALYLGSILHFRGLAEEMIREHDFDPGLSLAIDDLLVVEMNLADAIRERCAA